MRVFKHIQFAEGINLSLANFKKDFAPHLKNLNDAEVKQAHKVATKGNAKAQRITKKSPNTQSKEDK